MNSYIARQPILDKGLEIYGYELLYRSGTQVNAYMGENANQASSQTIMESFYTIGIDTITGRRPAFVNFTSSLLLENIATLFPKEFLAIELLEDIDPTPEVLAACRDLYDKGYVLILDDFEYRPDYDPLIKLCEIIKFDFLAHSTQEILDMLKLMNVKGKKLLAEKIETVEMFNQALDMGFTLFQGYFFSKPVMMTSKRLVPLKINYLSLLSEMNAGDDMDFGKLANIIRNDVALCHKLLRMVNSAYYGLRSEVTGIKRALAIMGTKEIRKWIYLISMMELSDNKPGELVKMSMIRGFFMEQLTTCPHLCFTCETMFFTGLFSLIDVLMEQPMEAVLGELGLVPEVCEALIDHAGQLYDLLQIVVGLERGEWVEVDRLTVSLGIDRDQVSDIYLNAVKWCNEIKF